MAGGGHGQPALAGGLADGFHRQAAMAAHGDGVARRHARVGAQGGCVAQLDRARFHQRAGKGEGEPTTADISPEMMEFAQLLAGACDWDKSLANRVLAMVFAESTKA